MVRPVPKRIDVDLDLDLGTLPKDVGHIKDQVDTELIPKVTRIDETASRIDVTASRIDVTASRIDVTASRIDGTPGNILNEVGEIRTVDFAVVKTVLTEILEICREILERLDLWSRQAPGQTAAPRPVKKKK